MFENLRICDTKEVAAKIFASTPTFVLQQIALGHFPQPSWRTPGNRGKLVWLVATVEQWLVEYDSLAPDERTATSTEERRKFRALANEAAAEATKIAEAFDVELKDKIFNRGARSAPGRESTSERDSTSMVATA